MIDLLKPNNLGGDFKALTDAVLSGKPTTAFSLAQGAKIHMASCFGEPILYITPDVLAAKDAYEKFKSYVGDKAVLLVGKDDILLHRTAYSHENTAERIKALTAIVQNKAEIIVMSAEALSQYLPNFDLFKQSLIKLEVDKEYNIETIIEKLVKGGYQRQEMAETQGTFSLRGDILDVYPLSFEFPIRINFFDVIIETIKYFDPETMESMNSVKKVCIPPTADILIDNTEKNKIIHKLDKVKTEGHIKDIINEIKFKLDTMPNDSTLVWLYPFIEKKSTIFDYLKKDTIIIFDEPKILNAKLELIEKEHFGRVKTLTEGNDVLKIHKKSLITKRELYLNTEHYRRLAYQQITSLNPIFKSKAQFSFNSRPLTKYYLDNTALITDLKNFTYNHYTVLLCCGDSSRANAIATNLKKHDVMVHVGSKRQSGIMATTLKIRTGFIYHGAKICVIGTDELFGKIRDKKLPNKPKRYFKPLKQGDYVVHSVHGIGICEGTDKLNASGIIKDYVIIRYRDGDKLYVPIDQMDLLTRYTGGETPRLNKIGGKEFKRTKDRVKKSVKKLAIDLLKLYKERENQKGFKYSPDTVWQKEFEDKFEFELTDDQQTAVDDIKADMEKGRLMDRLICGDVGYGKTEVAFRAIFKTIIDNKQAAILAPTTILAKQHYNMLRSRLEGFGISCVLLTRFQSTSETKQILKEIADGTVSIVIATHRLISKDVKFFDLGLLVLDEEQRFGVEQKEKMKAIKSDINILTLTATPIPRTLNMALTGLRDISLLETPPKNRLPVQNYIVEYTDGLLKDAVMREFNRGGQIFILYNYVETILDFAAKVQNILGDEIKIIVAHGQMSNNELDERITKFYQHEADVLISTTIIENGIDLPDANTLIVYDADRFGLAQLYQLRGRVGRSGMLAHAYFTTKAGKVLTEPAVKRLTALTDYSEFGSGFKIALRDLEIRGAGNFLGAEQHGHIEKVGYEMYSKLLSESVNEIKSGFSAETRDIEMKMDVNAYIAENYVSASDKIRIYKRISEVHNISERDELLENLTDVYGKPAEPLINLINIALIKSLAMGFDITKIVLNKKGAAFLFDSADVFKQESLLNAVSKMKDDVVLTATLPPQLMFSTKEKPESDIISDMIKFLCEAHKN